MNRFILMNEVIIKITNFASRYKRIFLLSLMIVRKYARMSFCCGCVFLSQFDFWVLCVPNLLLLDFFLIFPRITLKTFHSRYIAHAALYLCTGSFFSTCVLREITSFAGSRCIHNLHTCLCWWEKWKRRAVYGCTLRLYLAAGFRCSIGDKVCIMGHYNLYHLY